MRGLASGSLDGLATVASDAPARPPSCAPAHLNGALAVDHVVVATPDLDRTLAELAAAGLKLRRVREAGPARQAFYRVGDALLEVVGPAARDGDAPASFWGLTVVVADLDARSRASDRSRGLRATRSSQAGESRPCAATRDSARRSRS